MEENQAPQAQPTEKSSMNMGLIAVVIIAVLVLAGGGYMYVSNKSTTQTAPVASSDVTPTTAEASPTAMEKPTDAMMKKASYKDGSYDAIGNYVSPGGDETIDVKLTLKEGVVTDVTVTPQATRPMSKKYQTMFSEGAKAVVVGKNIDELNLTVVSGSSLAPKGFNDAVSKIKTQAKA